MFWRLDGTGATSGFAAALDITTEAIDHRGDTQLPA